MDSQAIVSDTFSPAGGHLDRLRQALTAAVDQARLAQQAGYGRNSEDALTETEDLAKDQLARLEGALDDDRTEARNTGERRPGYPLYRAV